MKTYDYKYNDLQVKSTSLQVELQNQKTPNDNFSHRIPSLENQCEDATASAASSSFSKFSQDEFKEMDIKTN